MTKARTPLDYKPKRIMLLFICAGIGLLMILGKTFYRVVDLRVNGIEITGEIASFVPEPTTKTSLTHYYMIRAGDDMFRVDLGTPSRTIGERVALVYDADKPDFMLEVERKSSFLEFLRQDNRDIKYLLLALADLGFFFAAWRVHAKSKGGE